MLCFFLFVDKRKLYNGFRGDLMNQMHIMIIEDDETLASEIKDFLKRWGYQAVIATHFDNVIQDFVNYKPHLILMDINLPYYDGYYWCTQIRNLSQVPIIFISSRNDDHDKIRAILQGGDDYVDKPFHLELLKAKIEAILRRTYQYKVKDQMRINEDIYYDKMKGSFFYHDQEIHLTKSESQIVCLLLESQGDIVSRQELMETLWNTDEFISDNSLTVLISRLRTKLKEACHQDIIYTKKGLGYYIP